MPHWPMTQGKLRYTPAIPYCPLARVETGRMVRGPQGAYKPLAGVIKATAGAIPLKRFPVELRDGAIWLVG